MVIEMETIRFNGNASQYRYHAKFVRLEIGEVWELNKVVADNLVRESTAGTWSYVDRCLKCNEWLVRGEVCARCQSIVEAEAILVKEKAKELESVVQLAEENVIIEKKTLMSVKRRRRK